MPVAPIRVAALLLVLSCDRPKAPASPAGELPAAQSPAAASVEAATSPLSVTDSAVAASDSAPVSPDVLAACESITVAASRRLREPSARVVSDTVFREAWTGTTRRGCSTIVTGLPIDRTKGTDILMETHPTPGWTTMRRFFADGPDGAAFALWRPGVMCSFQVSYAGVSDSDASDGPQDERLEVSCARDRPQDELDAAPPDTGP